MGVQGPTITLGPAAESEAEGQSEGAITRSVKPTMTEKYPPNAAQLFSEGINEVPRPQTAKSAEGRFSPRPNKV